MKLIMKLYLPFRVVYSETWWCAMGDKKQISANKAATFPFR